ncbi:MAG: hypothetical protein ABI947_25810 [Chloroflexota bacterium]
MTENCVTIYQSGQRVPVSGWYEAVGVNTLAMSGSPHHLIRTLRAGELFPDYEGRAICWCLLNKDLYITQAQTVLKK